MGLVPLVRGGAAVARALAGLLFVHGTLAGAVLITALMLRPGLALGGLVAVLVVQVAARLRRQPADGTGLLNALLAGLAVGHLLAPGLAMVVLAALAGLSALALSIGLTTVLRGLPVLCLPFCLTAMVAWLVVAANPHLAPATLGWELPVHGTGVLALDGFLRSCGSLLFQGEVLVGAVLFLVLVSFSRILALCAVLGWAGGLGLHLALGHLSDYAQARGDGFNAILVGLALGAGFRLPSPASLAAAVVGGAAATAVGDALVTFTGVHGVATFALPFCVVTLIALAGRRPHPMGHRPPEAVLCDHIAFVRRFPGTLVTLRPPLAVPARVWQGANGPWTHQGLWRHALDFVVGDDPQAIVGAQVLAPVRGRVVVAVDGLVDQAPGAADHDHRWGNAVVIEDPRGFWVCLAHLRQGTVQVAVGAWVEVGQFLGEVGSSGHAPRPHLHLQAQTAGYLGAPTLPFSLIGWWDGRRARSNELPREGDTVEALATDPALVAAMTPVLDTQQVWRIQRPGRQHRDLMCTLRMGVDGRFRLSTPDAALVVLLFEGTWYGERLEGRDRDLARLWAALPRLPLTLRDEVAWDDHLPADVLGGWRATCAGFLAVVWPRAATIPTRHRRVGKVIETRLLAGPLNRERLVSVTLDPARGPVRVVWDDGLILERT